MKIILNDILTDIGKWLPLSNVSEKVKESTPPQPRSPEDSERSIDALRQSVNEAG